MLLLAVLEVVENSGLGDGATQRYLGILRPPTKPTCLSWCPAAPLPLIGSTYISRGSFFIVVFCSSSF